MLNSNDPVIIRQEKIERMKSMWIIPYASKFDKKNNIKDLISRDSSNFRDVISIPDNPRLDAKTAGRITLYRSFGKIAFGKLQDSTWTIQIMFSQKNCSIISSEGKKSILFWTEEMTAFKFAEKIVDLGDFIGVEGELFKTQTGELTIYVDNFTFLAKAIRPLPEKFHWIKDEESIYRQRYLDLISNENSYNRFLLRSRLIKAIRDFYDEEGFIELETPILWNSASWAAAQPFTTHHNSYDMDVYLRIAPETALKKATVGRFERIFEIARNFRNEWSDPSHLQEFTAIEHYVAYWNFEDNMIFIEKMINSLFDRINMSKIVKIKDRNGMEKEVDFWSPWERIDYIEKIKEITGIDVLYYNTGDENIFIKDLKEKNIEIEGIDKMWLATMIDYLYKKLVRPNIVWPAFLYNYPKSMQPLARTSDMNWNIVEQVQVVVNWWEIIKAYSELVDPKDQRERFEEQAQAAENGDKEATSADYDFVLAMEYGMPPQSGLWFWLDRFLTLITGQENLRDIILFPLTKPKFE